MQIPQDKKSFAVFLRDYGGRSEKTSKEKIAIMTEILETRKVMIPPDIEYTLNDEEYDRMNSLYHKFVLGKWIPQITESKILGVLENHRTGVTIEQAAKDLKCADEVVRRKLNALVKEGKVIKLPNPENRRQGIFMLKRNAVVKSMKVVQPSTVEA